MKTKITRLIVAALSIAAPAIPASAAVIGLTFEGVGNLAQVDDFYNGGTDSAMPSGTNYGVEFLPGALGIIDADVGGGSTGNFANAPSPSTVLFFLQGSSAILNYAAGFDTGFSFYYSAAQDASVSIYDAVGGSTGAGSVIDSFLLPTNWQNGPCDTSNGDFCNWDAAGIGFSGTAYSIEFIGIADLVGFDNVTFGSVTPVPLPAGIWLLGSGLLGLAAARRRR